MGLLKEVRAFGSFRIECKKIGRCGAVILITSGCALTK